MGRVGRYDNPHLCTDFARHYAVPDLLEAGCAVFTQNSRWLGNDSMLIHEKVLLDVAAGVRYLRYTDRDIDPSGRDYGSILGRRPDLIDYGPFGSARVVTPEAWLSTWSGLSSNASIYLRAGGVDVATIVIHYDGDDCVFPSQAARIHDSAGSVDKSIETVADNPYGDPECAEPLGAGRRLALRELVAWLGAPGGAA